MPVVKLRRGKKTEWLLQIPENDLTDEEAAEKALEVANGKGKGRDRINPANGRGGWEVVSVHADEHFHSLYLPEQEVQG
jgi:hypothetical protein